MVGLSQSKEHRTTKHQASRSESFPRSNKTKRNLVEILESSQMDLTLVEIQAILKTSKKNKQLKATKPNKTIDDGK